MRQSWVVVPNTSSHLCFPQVINTRKHKLCIYLEKSNYPAEKPYYSFIVLAVLQFPFGGPERWFLPERGWSFGRERMLFPSSCVLNAMSLRRCKLFVQDPMGNQTQVYTMRFKFEFKGSLKYTKCLSNVYYVPGTVELNGRQNPSLRTARSWVGNRVNEPLNDEVMNNMMGGASNPGTLQRGTNQDVRAKERLS